LETKVPTIQTSRLVLRPFTENDIDRFHEILIEKDMLRYFPKTDPPPWDKVQTMVLGIIKHWNERGYGLWAVEPKSPRVLMGRCGLQYLPDTDEIEVDGLLSREAWNKGYATEAAKASLRYGFHELKLDFVVGIVHPKNMASRRVLEKIGMTLSERKQYFGMDCYRYVLERDQYLRVSGTGGTG
jgi:ribosomal-protein-alanine N-acetyltransferase